MYTKVNKLRKLIFDRLSCKFAHDNRLPFHDLSVCVTESSS